MNKNLINKFFAIVFVVTTLSSCIATNKTMREPNALVEFEKSDFTLSGQVAGTATTTRVLGIDWTRLFRANTGNVQSSGLASLSLASIPVIGTYIADVTSNYALYELMEANPGYDVVFYPQFETVVKRPVLLGIIYSKTTVKATARLGKLKD